MSKPTDEKLVKLTAPRKKATADQAARATDGLQNLVAGLGSNRDKMSYSAYTAPMLLDRQTLENMYASSWIAAKIVDIPADDMTREWRSVMFDDDDVQEDNQFAIEEEEKRLGVVAKINEALKWARLFGGSSIVIGAGGSYETPLDPASIKKGGLKHLHVFDRHVCEASGQVDWRIDSPNFGLPEFYRIGAGASQTKVHHSRVIRFIGRKQPYYASIQRNYWGDSMLQSAYDTLIGKDTTTAAIATMIFEANVDVLKVDGLTELLSTSEGETKALKRFQLAALMKSFNRVLLMDSTEEFEKKSNSFASLDAIMREFRAEVAGAADIPVTRLFGTSVGGLNATGDNEIRNYYDMVASQQRMVLCPALDKLDQVLIRSALGNFPEDYRYQFKPLWQMDETEKATVEKTRADRDKLYFDMGVLTEGTIAKQLKEDGTYSVMTEEDVDLAEELAEASAEIREAGQEALLNGQTEVGPDGKPIPPQPTSAPGSESRTESGAAAAAGAEADTETEDD